MLICNISVMNKYGKNELDRLLATKGFNWREMVVLMILEQKVGANQSLIGSMVQLEKGNTTKLLNKMEKSGLIKRQATEQDRRYRQVFLTDEGRAFLPRLHQLMKEWEDKCHQGMTDEERQTYQALSLKVMANMTGFKEGEKRW